jgi:hypothetical protein
MWMKKHKISRIRDKMNQDKICVDFLCRPEFNDLGSRNTMMIRVRSEMGS